MYSLLNRLKDGGISIWISGEDLKVSYDPKTLDKTLIEELKCSKPALIALLKNNLIYDKEAFLERELYCLETGPADLSLAQQGMLFLEHFEKKNNAYHIPYIAQLHCEVDITTLSQALNGVATQHRILKTIYQIDPNGVFYPQFVPDEIVCQRVSMATSQQMFDDINTQMLISFDLVKDIPLRCYIYTVAQTKFLFIMWHHIAFDGWSHRVFIDTLISEYTACLQAQPPEGVVSQPRSRVDYFDYATWQKSSLQSGKLASQLSRWSDLLEDHTPLVLPLDLPRPVKFDYRGDDVFFSLSDTIILSLKDQAKQLNTTPYTLVLSAFYLLLHRLSSQRDLIIGTTSDNRSSADTHGIIGCLVNSIVLRCQINPKDSIAEFVQYVHALTVRAKSNQALPFDALVNTSKVTRDTSRHPLFQVMFNYEQVSASRESNALFSNESIELEDHCRYSPAKFDLSLVIEQGDNYLKGRFNYATALFKKGSVQRFSEMFQLALKAVIGDANTSIDTIDLLSVQHRKKILALSQNDNHETTTSELIHEIFERQAERFPNKIAIVDGSADDLAITYESLNNRANRVANDIVLSVTGMRETNQSIPFVGLLLEPGIDMIVAMLACLKAGVAYVPIGSNYPTRRIKFIIEDTKMALCITHRAVTNNLEELFLSEGKLDLAIIWADKPISSGGNNLNCILSPDDPAYVIYTSGSTGQPKGVVQPHKNVQRLFSATHDTFSFSETDVWTLFHAYTFDFSVWEIWGALLFGGKLIIPSKAITFDTQRFIQLCHLHKVTVLNQTPAAFYLFQEQAIEQPDCVRSLKYVIFGGDKLNLAQIKPWWQHFRVSQPKLFNMYGITETTVHVTYKELTPNDYLDQSLIGKPIADMNVYILTPEQKLSGIGVFGEMYVGGAGLAHGYLNREALTNERFISNKIITEMIGPCHHPRLYRTGDIARWLDNGELEYLGRNDDQIKVRGYRIETAEVEAALSRIEGIKQSLVTVQQNPHGNQLIAFFVAESGFLLHEHTIVRALKEHLPAYMLPDHYVPLTHLPLTVNGKVNRRALPIIDVMSEQAFVAPSNELEEILCQIWQALLGVEKVGINDNFFSLGGNSISAIRMSAMARKRLQVDIPLADLFASQTISKLAEKLANGSKMTIPRMNLDLAPLSFSQQRVLFIEQLEAGTSLYHMPYLMKLKPEILLPQLYEAFRLVIQRHEPLHRIVINADDGENYTQSSDFLLKDNLRKISDITLLHSHVRDDIAQPFSLSEEVPIRIHSYQCADEQYLLVLIHHIAFDGWSEDILFGEVTHVYESMMKKAVPDLPQVTLAYSDYAYWQRKNLENGALEQALTYWTDTLTDYENLELPLDYQRPDKPDHQGDDIHFVLPQALSSDLKRIAQAEKTTLHNVLLSGFYILLARVSGQNDVIVGSPTDNRQHGQTQDILGFFGNSLALRTDISKSETVSALIQNVTNTVNNARVHQELPFEQLVEVLEVERDLSRHPIFQILFTVMRPKKDTSIALLWDPMELSAADMHSSPAKFDISLFMCDDSDKVSGTFNFATSLFSKTSIENYITYYQCILSNMVMDLATPISRLRVFPDSMRSQLLNDWSYNDGSAPTGSTIPILFEQQAALTPDKLALIYDDKSLSYRQLNEQANQLAHFIRETYELNFGKVLQADVLITLFYERGIDMIIAMLGVMKSGAAYVPIAQDVPEQRFNFIQSDTDAALLLCQQKSLDKLVAWNARTGSSTQLIATDSIQFRHGHSLFNPVPIATTHSLAYVIYTSGTTGLPKGVMIEHHTFTSFSQVMVKMYSNEGAGLSFLSMTSYAFDMFCSEYPLSLLSGGCLILTTPHRAVQDLRRYSKQIDIIQQTPSLWKMLLTELSSDERYKHIDVSIGGESGSKELFMVLADKFSRVFQAYGPTETCVWSCVGQFKSCNERNIGKPLAGEAIYILDEYLEPVPLGSVGEIYISGIGLAKGYLNREELTSERFIDNPHRQLVDSNSLALARMYKTGDLAKWLPDGCIEYIGRNDHQVKVNGYRIELSEIEQTVQNVTGCAQVVVLVDTLLDRPVIVAYLAKKDVSTNDEECYVVTLKAQLSAYLPVYMVPEYVIFIDALPLNQNGKLDRNALPVLDMDSHNISVAPRNSMEQLFFDIWKELLGKGSFGIHDDFFRVGGHSLNVANLANQAQKQGLSLTLKELYQNRTIASQAKLVLDAGRSVTTTTIAKQTSGKSTKASYLIQNWWRETQKGLTKSNITAGTEVSVPAGCSILQLQQCLQYLYQHHDILRTRINDVDGDAWLEVMDDHPLSISYYDISADLYPSSYEELLTQLYDPAIAWQGVGLHLRNMPPVEVAVITTQQGVLVHILIDHILSDGISSEVLRSDLRTLMAQCSAAEPLMLATNSFSFFDYIYWLEHDYKGSQGEQEAELFWNKQNVLYRPTRLPHDYDYTGTDTGTAKTTMGLLGSELSRCISEYSTRTGLTKSNILFTLFNYAVANILNVEVPAVGLVLSGRNIMGTQRLAGNFADIIFLPSPILPHSYSTADFSSVSQLIESASFYLTTNHRKYLPFGISPSDERETIRQPSTPFVFSYDAFTEELISTDHEFTEEKVIVRKNTGAMNFIWVRVAECENDLLITVDIEGEYYSEETLLRIAQQIKTTFKDVMSSVSFKEAEPVKKSNNNKGVI
ncbi:non-ribosomal peptide synthetase [Pseudoalteromonas aurantia]|uniref:Carrier domain-containing protein n=4 Tax=Pseudoalteromonas TaxID=53246 RepID=A0A5S3V9G6_9GAMM|nr:non-ribosomal peptide synthetase [Pseudoalteromonas aurantia]TMO68534.1 hypothetical protein CWC19_08960 [Pseudoalteromonas aurantia]